MRKFLLVLGILALICSPAMAGKNDTGAMVVHTDDAVVYTNFPPMCDQFDTVVPPECRLLGTQTNTEAGSLVWFIAAFDSSSAPGVTVCYFGNNHNLAPGWVAVADFCGPAGTIQIPDTGWPDYPATAGNSVAFGSPVVGDILFPFYHFNVYGYADVYFGSGINPTGGRAEFVDDSVPPGPDIINKFGTVRWYVAGENDCPAPAVPEGACCFDDGHCIITQGEDACLEAGGYDYVGDGSVCDPNPCPQLGGCCFDDGSCVVALEEACYGMGGTSFIPGDDCSPNQCPQPPEACCAADGTCTFVPPDQCAGTPWGPGTDCDPNPCPQPPMGACCETDGACTMTLEEHCAYEWHGEWDTCDPNPCPQPPTGACCYDCALCVVATEAECMDIAGWYLWIEGDDCDPNPCPPVATEITTWGSIKANYR